MKAFIQWKATDACIDLNCKCGGYSQINGDFAYFIECPHCGLVYECVPQIEIRELRGVPRIPPIKGK